MQDPIEDAAVWPFAAASIGEMAENHANVIADLQNLHRIRVAATFGALLTRLELQANCFRIDVLVHLAVAFGAGNATPTKGFIWRSFKALGNGYCGKLEDPAEARSAPA